MRFALSMNARTTDSRDAAKSAKSVILLRNSRTTDRDPRAAGQNLRSAEILSWRCGLAACALLTPRRAACALVMALGVLTVEAASRADEPPKIDRAAFMKVSNSVDDRFRTLWPDYPAELVGVTHTVYIHGYGAVVTGEVNVAPSSGITPFHQTISKEDVARAHQKKMQRMPALRTAMQALLVQAAAELRDVPDNEEIAVAVSLFYWVWEDKSGLPDQVVMHASKKALATAARDKTLGSVVRVEEY